MKFKTLLRIFAFVNMEFTKAVHLNDSYSDIN